MSTFNENIRRELGFGLIAWNAPEHRSAMMLPRPHAGKPARENDCAETTSSTGALEARALVSVHS
ncbi:hypothetical protein [Noviherbaspirillum denitrificans]|nr:hypothetical protein [Noviherbaspirillum denitrificans]